MATKLATGGRKGIAPMKSSGMGAADADDF